MRDDEQEMTTVENVAPEVLTVTEVAVLLRISRASAYRAVRRRDIPGVVQVGKAVRVHRRTLIAWLEGRQTYPAAPLTRKKRGR